MTSPLSFVKSKGRSYRNQYGVSMHMATISPAADLTLEAIEELRLHKPRNGSNENSEEGPHRVGIARRERRVESAWADRRGRRVGREVALGAS